MKIQAALLREHNTPFAVETLELAPPQAQEVQVQVKAAGVCHSDWHLLTGATQYPLPLVPGHEGAGVVVGVGERVTRVRVGDPVTLNWAGNCGACFYCHKGLPSLCPTYTKQNWGGTLLDGTTRLTWQGQSVYQFKMLGCFAQYCVVPEPCCIPIPPTLPFPIAALIGCAVTTGMGAVLNKAHIQSGESMAVFGVGGVGLSMVLAGHFAGAHPIVAVDTQPVKLEIARTCGATHTLLMDEHTLSHIRKFTEGRGADYVFEAIGIPSVQEQCLEAVRPGGSLILAGLSPMGSLTNFPGAILTRQEKTVTGTYYGSSDPTQDFPRFAHLHLDRKIDLSRLIAQTYPLSAINEAFAAMNQGKTARGVIVF
jgi:Zn-dependent alcohol dehydrogenase